MEQAHRRWSGPALLALAVLLPLAVYYPAYQGWFEDDDLDTLTWARKIPLADLVRNIPSLKYPPEHARPTGYFYYDAIGRRFGLEYPPYVAVLQIAGAINIVLLWLVLRRLDLPAAAAAAGCLFFALHRALFDAWWKPMFVYDVLCTTFALASLVAYLHRRWVLSFLAFWLAMRSKEVGIVVPLILLWYQATLGGRKWIRVIPFFVPAAVYGALGLMFNLHQQSSYTFHFDAATVWRSAQFYFGRLLGIRYAGFAFLLLPLAVRDRRIWFGAGALVLGLGIYLPLPGRMLEVYLYLAMTGAAVAVATLAARRPALAMALLAAWCGWQYQLIRKSARATLAAAGERRAYVAALRRAPDSPIYVYDAIPASMHSWGVEGALRLYHDGIAAVHRLEDAGLPVEGSMLLLDWDAGARRLAVTPVSPLAAASISAEHPPAAWQILRGWRRTAGGDWEIEDGAAVRLYRPAGARELEATVCGEGVELRITAAGEEPGAIAPRGCAGHHWLLRPAPAGVAGVQFRTVPAGRKVRIVRLGFSGAGEDR